MTDNNQGQDQSSKIINITINVDLSQTANTFKVGEMFFQTELDEAVRNIKKLVKRNKNPDDDNPRKPLTIFGDRGTGKTSFLNALKKSLREDNELNICVLETLEPNRIEKNEIFLVSIIVSIMKEVQKRNNDDNVNLQSLHDILDDLAKTFNILTPKGQISERDRSESAIGFAERVISDSDSGISIYERFRKFINQACKCCKCDAFLVCIDDTDVAYQSCGDIMETVRKYLDVKGLAVVIAAEEELLNIHLTKYYLSWICDLLNLEAKLMKGPGMTTHNMEHYFAQAHTLKEQYLNKTLPNHYRIYLAPLIQKINDDSYNIILLENTEGNTSDQHTSKCLIGECLEPFTMLIGQSLKMTTDFLPASNRSLMRMLKILFKLRKEEQNLESQNISNGQENGMNKYDENYLLRKFLEDLDGLFRPARHELDVHGQMLRELRQGKGDYALLKWILHRAVDIPRSFNLTVDHDVQGDDRRVVPALVHASWGYGCRAKRRIDVFLSYGIRIVLPIYHLGWVSNRFRTVQQLEYHLDTIEHQECVMTTLRLLEWYESYHRYDSDFDDLINEKNLNESIRNKIHMQYVMRNELTPGFIPQTSKDNSEFKWYQQIKNSDGSFFLGLARVADLCDLWQKNKNEQDIQKYLDKINDNKIDNNEFKNWKTWLKLNDMLYNLEEKYQVLPVHIIGEIFILLYNHWREVLKYIIKTKDNKNENTESAEAIQVENYVYAFWYAILCWEMAWRDDKKWSAQLANFYRTIKVDDIIFLLQNNDQKVFLPHSIVWLLCPLFRPYLEKIKVKDKFLFLPNMKIENAFAKKEMGEYKKIVQELLGENLKGWK